MISKEKIKWLSSLKLKKNRQTEKLFVAEGVKIADEILGTEHRFLVHSIYATAQWLSDKERQKKMARYSHLITEVSQSELERISELQTPNQVLVVLHATEPQGLNLTTGGLFLALDTLQDPGNLGTIIRIADWFAVSGILCSEGCAELYNPKVLQASMGSFLRIPVWQNVDLTAVLSQCPQNTPIYGALLDGNDIFKSPVFDKRGILVIGNESQGISLPLLPLIRQRISIPRFGQAESLNAAVATGILCAFFR